MTVHDIREHFKFLLWNKDFITDKSGVKLMELKGLSFLADDVVIFGKLDGDYAARELEWYRSESLSVDDIPGKTPKIWKDVADREGFINSNYGWCIWSKENGDQYNYVKGALNLDSNTRRASAIYTRPSMHTDFNKNGMSDFICTYGVDYSIKDGKLDAVVHMRSNDVVFGYKNDRFWQKYVQRMLALDLGLDIGDLYWSVSSLHIYERHFHLVEEYSK